MREKATKICCKLGENVTEKKSIINRNDSGKKIKHENAWEKKCKLCDVSQKKCENRGIQARKKVALDKVQTNYAGKRRFKSTRNDPINKTESVWRLSVENCCVDAWASACCFLCWECMCSCCVYVILNQRKQRDGTMITKWKRNKQCDSNRVSSRKIGDNALHTSIS